MHRYLRKQVSAMPFSNRRQKTPGSRYCQPGIILNVCGKIINVSDKKSALPDKDRTFSSFLHLKIISET